MDWIWRVGFRGEAREGVWTCCNKAREAAFRPGEKREEGAALESTASR